MMRTSVRAAFLVGFLLSTPCLAESLPSYVTLPGSVQVANADALTVEDYGEAEFVLRDGEDPVVKRGKHWKAGLVMAGLPEDTAQRDIWSRIKPSLEKGGWKVVVQADANPMSATMHLQRSDKDAWLSLSIFGGDDLRLDVIEVKEAHVTFALKAPAATPEKIAPESGDFPYLPPLPGSHAGTGSHNDAPMAVMLPGATEPELVGTGWWQRNYTAPDGLSNVLFASTYHQALVGAGWTIVNESQGIHQTDVELTTHYAGNGRNIWARLHFAGGEYSLAVADVGAMDLAQSLKKDCHVALYGVLFDFNKATLKKESEPVLQRVLELLQKDPSLQVEIQGHTDNKGGGDYNMKLSDSRAKSVVSWLTAHGVKGSRLSAKGYGKNQPVATNDTEEGRARNRRVEIARQNCTR